MELIRNLEECDSLRYEIEHNITRDLQISDNASGALREIRRSLRREEGGQQKIINGLLMRYKDYLNDERVALRNGAFALPIKAAYKSRVDGIVIDESDTGLTLFKKSLGETYGRLLIVDSIAAFCSSLKPSGRLKPAFENIVILI